MLLVFLFCRKEMVIISHRMAMWVNELMHVDYLEQSWALDKYLMFLLPGHPILQKFGNFLLEAPRSEN